VGAVRRESRQKKGRYRVEWIRHCRGEGFLYSEGEKENRGGDHGGREKQRSDVLLPCPPIGVRPAARHGGKRGRAQKGRCEGEGGKTDAKQKGGV